MSDIGTILNRWTDSVHESVADLLGYGNVDEVGVSELAMATAGSAVVGAVGGTVAHVAGVVGVIAGIGVGASTGCATMNLKPDANGIYTIDVGYRYDRSLYKAGELAIAAARKKAANYCADKGQYVNEVSSNSYSENVTIRKKECSYETKSCKSYESRIDPKNSIPIGRGKLCRVHTCHEKLFRNVESWTAVLKFKCAIP